MKSITVALMLAAAALTGARAQEATPFPYPEIPDTLTVTRERADYMLGRFWQQADMKKLLADDVRLTRAFSDYVALMPYASPDSIRTSVNALMKPYRNDAKATLRLMEQAERHMLGPEATVRADQPYLTFTRALFANKKVKAADKARYMEQVKMLNGSQAGSLMQNIPYTTVNGALHTLYEQPGEYKAVYFHPAGCPDCGMVLLRLGADAAVASLSRQGRLKVIDLLTGGDDPEWKEGALKYPYEWEAGTATDASAMVDLRDCPVIYLLDGENKIIAKNLSVDSLLHIASALYKNLGENEKAD